MSIITKVLKQKAVLWSQGEQAPDGYGNPRVSAPVEIKCRWEDTSEEFIAADGTKQLSKSVVMVDRDLRAGDVLWLGLLADVPDRENAKNNPGAWEVRSFQKLPNFKNTEYLRTAYL